MGIRQDIINVLEGHISHHAEAIDYLLKQPVPLSAKDQAELADHVAKHARYMTFLRRFSEATPAQHESSSLAVYDPQMLLEIVAYMLAVDDPGVPAAEQTG